MFSILLLGCETDTKLTFENTSFKGGNCDTCADIKVEVPRALDELKIAKSINSVIDEEIIYTLKFDEEVEVSTVDGAITSFDNSFQDMLAEFGPTSEPWEAKVNGKVTFENMNVVTIALENYTYTGGAHGYFSKVFLNFDRRLGKEIEIHELFDDQMGFLQLAESKFRMIYEIPQAVNINATGFMFNKDTFHLPENLGYTENGIELHYNQYEVASYADGPLKLVVSFDEAHHFLKKVYRAKSK